MSRRTSTGITAGPSPTFSSGVVKRVYDGIYHLHGPQGVFARTWTTGAIAFWAVIGLLAFLVLYYWER